MPRCCPVLPPHPLLPGGCQRRLSAVIGATWASWAGSIICRTATSSSRASCNGRWTKIRTGCGTIRTPTRIRWPKSRWRSPRARATTLTAGRAARVTSPGRPTGSARARSSGWNWSRRCSGPPFSGRSRCSEDRGNDVLVVVTPFNEHMMADQSLSGYRAIQPASGPGWRRTAFLRHAGKIASELYADASHPLTAGYESLARIYLSG